MDDLSMLTSLAKKYESGGNPAAISSGAGDLGGISYGTYQLSSNAGSVEAFLAFACEYKKPELANYAVVLNSFEINSQEFRDTWHEIGTIDPDGFGELQDAYAKATYFDIAADELCDHRFCVAKHSMAMKAVIMSRAVQYGPGNIVELLDEACSLMKFPNLSYIDDSYFDRPVINTIYDFLDDECDRALLRPTKDGMCHSPADWVNGSEHVVRALKNRFANECRDAMAMLEEERKTGKI